MLYRFSRRTSFYIRFFALVMLFCFLLADLITAIVFPMERTQNLKLGERVSDYYAFFTTETNYLVAIYFAIYLYNSYFNRTLPSIQIRIAVTVYISVTMLVFWTAIFTKTQNPSLYNIYNWFDTIILHLIMPVAMITSFILTSGKEKINIKKWHRNYLWVICIYPAVYSIVILIRGHLRYLDHCQSDTLYPYFFFNVDQTYGYIIASFACICIFSLVISLQYLYIYINNKMYYLRQSEEAKLEKFYNRTLEKLGKRTRNRKY